ncbi:MAG: class I tRNA ligase family protein [Anaerolineae bacterium]|nr:class I tRNA ligase family protein [Anaerolineae bacterium]
MTYGTGAIMAVPGHDERDFEFALKFGLPIIPVIERTDGLARSLVFPGSVPEGFAEKLIQLGIAFTAAPVGTVGEGLYVTLKPDQVEAYVALMQANLLPNNWNDIIGSQWKFIFSDGIFELDSVEADQAILARCKTIWPPVSGNRTVMEMLSNLPFYREVLLHAEYGAMIHSGEFSGTPGDRAKKAVTEHLEKLGVGKRMINYRLRDWLISRQRYWGAPIPIIYCEKCGPVAVPEDQLPVLLPDDVEWKPTGESPLKLHPTWRFTTCPECGGPAERETDTMDTFMCSSWYHLRYLSPKYDKGPFDPQEYAYWMPVDTYTGGAEHSTMHLIYTRFFHKALTDLGWTKGREPMLQLRNQGQILGPDGQRMSKSRGNVVDPDEQVRLYGADTVRAFMMFGYRWAEGGPWEPGSIQGSNRWLRRLWLTVLEPADKEGASEETLKTLRRKVHQTLRAVGRDFEQFEFNTIVSALMNLLNEMQKAKQAGAYGTPVWNEAVEIYLKMVAPVTPHISEELWAQTGHSGSIHVQPWPVLDEEATKEDAITLVLQVNGKVRDRLVVPVDISEEEAKQMALNSQPVQKFLEGRAPRQVIYVKGKLVNIVG